ncbi:hypothetical protein [Haloferula rosea]|uniref:Uncharacterized protein n=1 Tax=Haloferula rosea TaxID=490093 RepID=A0A934RDP2_9BACT|nr:hypothetical protein [Haloferula rosea]MBK1828670.1 hypothetical protein [Haloferula rosea]
MKPAVTISLVVVAVLTTVVIEEIRIKQLRAEVLRLRQIPTDQPVKITPDDILAKETPLPGKKPLAPVDPTEVTEKPDSTATTDTPAASPTPAPTGLPGTRNVPADYPEPSEERIKEVALGAYSDLHYDLGLNNQERVYLDDLLGDRLAKQQQFAQAWVGADEADRAAIEEQMAAHRAESDEALKTFFGRDADYQAFVTYHAMQPERTMLSQLIPMMDQQGVSLELADEQKLIAAMYEARMAAKGIDWNSTDALKAVVAGDAKARFDKEWTARNEFLADILPDFLDEKTIEVLTESRKQLKETIIESLDSAIEAINGSPEAGDE